MTTQELVLAAALLNERDSIRYSLELGEQGARKEAASRNEPVVWRDVAVHFGRLSIDCSSDAAAMVVGALRQHADDIDAKLLALGIKDAPPGAAAMSDIRPPVICCGTPCGGRAPDFDGRERPARMTVFLTPPAEGGLMFALLHGGYERFEFAGVDFDSLYEALMSGTPELDDGAPLPLHPRFERAEITDPGGSTVVFERASARAISRGRNPR